MSEIVIRPDGKMQMNPTDPTGVMKAAGQREAAESSAREKEALRIIRERREKAEKNRLTPVQRMEAASDGLQRLAKRLNRRDEAAGPKVQELATEAKAHLKAYLDAEKAQAKLTGDPVKDAIEAAAKTLFKVLGKACLPTMADALLFAERALPLTDAKHAASRLHDQRHKVDKARQAAADAFWLTIERGVSVGGIGIDNKAVEQLVKMGDM